MILLATCPDSVGCLCRRRGAGLSDIRCLDHTHLNSNQQASGIVSGGVIDALHFCTKHPRIVWSAASVPSTSQATAKEARAPRVFAPGPLRSGDTLVSNKLHHLQLSSPQQSHTPAPATEKLALEHRHSIPEQIKQPHQQTDFESDWQHQAFQQLQRRPATKTTVPSIKPGAGTALLQEVQCSGAIKRVG